MEERPAASEPIIEEISGDDPIVKDLEERMRKLNANNDLTLDMVLNPGTIVNTERDIIMLRAELAATPDEKAERRKELEDKIEAKQMKVVNEMRQVMTDGLKLEFLIQGLLNIPFCALLTYDLFPFVPDLSGLGLTEEAVRLILRIYGAWGVWLVTIPALRARKPGGPYGMGYEEKRALDVSFLLVPFALLITPFISKSPAATLWASVLVLAAIYVWSFNTPLSEEARAPRRGVGGSQDATLPEPIMWTIRALDFGTGQERGEDKQDETWQARLRAYEEAAQELSAKRAKLKEDATKGKEAAAKGKE